ncbi:MAG: DUF1289 domain-containing protein [Novosphingobium sp.]|nr:DUF1289 domain-containing protein [Novosphingobium sp.]
MIADPPSPCVRVCEIDKARAQCRGCHRTLDEIARWPYADAAGKQAILRAAALRQSESVRSI